MVAALIRKWTRRGRRRQVLALGVGAVIVILVLVGAMVVGGGAGDGFRLRSTTMVPTELHLASDLECPEPGSSSPIDHRDAGELAHELPVYEGELVAVRIRVDPYSTELPDEVTFDASWPTDVVAASGPTCAFVVGSDDAAPPRLEWERTGPAMANFSLVAPGRQESTTIEVWLEAVDPQAGALLLTTLGVSDPRDAFVIDTIGGRINVERRPGSPAVVSLTSDSAEIGPNDELELLATVANQSDEQRSFGVTLALESSVDDTVFRADSGACAGGDPFACEIGPLMPGESVQIPISMQVPSFPPATVGCGDQGRSIGMCVQVNVTSDISSDRSPSTRSAYLLLTRAGSSTGDLSITADPPTVVRRPGEPAVAHLLVTSNAASDVTSIEVVGSDCVVVERTEGADDDGDAFLAPDEIWAFDCTLASDSPAQFRVDIAGVDGSGARLVGSYDGVIEVVAPELEFEFREGDDGATIVTLANIGRGSLEQIALRLPGCDNQAPAAIEDLQEGEQVEIECTAGDIVEDDVVAYGVDPGGQPFAIRHVGGSGVSG